MGWRQKLQATKVEVREEKLSKEKHEKLEQFGSNNDEEKEENNNNGGGDNSLIKKQDDHFPHEELTYMNQYRNRNKHQASRPNSQSSTSLCSSSGSSELLESTSSCCQAVSEMTLISKGNRQVRSDSHGESTSGTEDVDSSSHKSSARETPPLDDCDSNHLMDFKQLNTHINLIPESKQANQVINAIRVKFLESLTKQSTDLYEKSDLDELRKELPHPNEQEQSLAVRLISRYLREHHFELGEISEKESSEVVETLNEFLQLRKHYQLARIRPDQFCKELHLLHGIFPFGYDKQKLPVLYLRANVHRRWSQKLDESFRRYVMWQIDVMTKSYQGAKVQKSIGRAAIEKDGSFGICFDCIHVSYSCVDMDFLRFIVRLLVHCYPTYCRYALCVDLPWLFRSIWKLVRSWLPEEAQNTVQLITSDQLNEFIDESQIPRSIRISDDEQIISEQPIHRLPENYDSIRDFDEFAKELNLSSSEIRSFKLHIAKVVKEYKKMGALPQSIFVNS